MKMRLEEIDIESIEDGYQPRKEKVEPEDDAALRQNIEAKGLVDPIIVTPKPNGKYERISGGRRQKAAKAVGLKAIPAIIKEDMTEERKAEEALIANEYFQSLDQWDRGDYLEANRKPGETNRSLGKRFGMDDDAINGALKFTRIPQAIREEAREHGIAPSTLRDISYLPEKEVPVALRATIDQGLKQNEVEKLIPIINRAPEPIKKAILEQKIEARDIIPIMEKGKTIDEDKVEPLVEELKERKSMRDAHEQFEERKTERFLETGQGPIETKKIKSQDQIAFDKFMHIRDFCFTYPSHYLVDIEDEELAKKAREAVGYVVDKCLVWAKLYDEAHGLKEERKPGLFFRSE